VFAVDVELEPGEFHSFDVLVDGNLIFSKFEEDRFPEPEEIVELIRAYLDQKENVSREIIGVSP
jgi:predicted Rdx family selenoprotein